MALRGNRFAQIALLQKLECLVELDLSENKAISGLPLFAVNQSLAVLKVANCSLSAIGELRCSSLRCLWLSKNRISKIENL